MARANIVAALSVTREGTQKSFPTADELLARHAISLIDHTSLGLDDTDEKIRSLVDAAVAEDPHTAAVCIYPKFVKLVREMQASNPQKYPRSLRVCTVVNFPGGQEPVAKVVEDTKKAVADGADEIDVVIDYKLMKQDESKGRAAAEELVRAVRGACPEGQVVLKVIIESGELTAPKLIQAASEAAIAGGCDFVKTSTGKVKVNATPEAAKIMLQACAAHKKRRVGFKAAGGVKNVEQAKQYLELAAEVLLGEPKRLYEVDADKLRFGASSLLPSLRGCCTAEARNSRKRSAQEAGLQGY
jgi:deoxyribose-phosphate aldolase